MFFNLALNFLHDENSAADATQEIFIKAHNAIASFRQESTVSTWIYRIAYNYLVDLKRLKFKEEISFEMFEQDVNNYTPYFNELNLSDTELNIYIEPIKIGCTKAILQCLDPIDRFVFILGKIFDFNSKTGFAICEMTEESYRQRLSRATKKVTNFMNNNCGLINPNATCHCSKRICIALDRNRINSDMLLHHTDSTKIKDCLSELNKIDSVAAIFRDNPYIDTSKYYTKEIHEAVKALAGISI